MRGWYADDTVQPEIESYPMTTPALTQHQKRDLYRDGYVVLENAVSDELVAAARARIKAAKKDERLGGDRAMTDLVNGSSITPILHEAMGYFDPTAVCQVGVIKPSRPGTRFTNLGYRDCDMPYYGAGIHMDGNITIAALQEAQEGTPEEIYRRHFASGPKGDIGRSPEVMGHNMVPLFEDPDMTLGLGSFTAFVIVCLNDQTRAGCGQTAMLRGAHHAMEKFFRWRSAPLLLAEIPIILAVIQLIIEKHEPGSRSSARQPHSGLVVVVSCSLWRGARQPDSPDLRPRSKRGQGSTPAS